MNRIIIFFTSIIVLATLASSCSFIQKGEFAQRKYYDFPRNKHTLTKANSSEVPLRAEEVKQEEASVSTLALETEVVASTKEFIKKPSVGSALKRFTVNNIERKKDLVINLIENSGISFSKREIKKQAKGSSAPLSVRIDAQTKLIISVIAAIFFPPVGIFIKENWRTTKWFWITLLLCIAAGTVWAIGNTGYRTISSLCWLTAIIIALFAIFDKI